MLNRRTTIIEIAPDFLKFTKRRENNKIWLANILLNILSIKSLKFKISLHQREFVCNFGLVSREKGIHSFCEIILEDKTTQYKK